MILTGKCKEDFLLKWFSIDGVNTLEDIPHIEQDFNMTQNSLKYSLIVDFFDKNNIYIGVQPYIDLYLGYCRGFEVTIYDEQVNKTHIILTTDNDVFNNRNDGLIEAIKKSNDLYNEKHPHTSN